ncbi:MAG: hypothetical protein GY869_29065 [Planctomycetes bacterium]|nr:hypothetical protein [Planctomycetota bacterium]
MAKKQTLNIIEAHLEKIALGAAVAVCLAVILLRFVVGTGINGEPASEVTNRAGQLTDGLVDDMDRPGTKIEIDPPISPGEIIKVEPVTTQNVDRKPFDSPNAPGKKVGPNLEPMPIPAVPLLKDVIVDLTHAQANVPASIGSTNPETKDVDFVTVEAVFPIATLRESFRNSFGDQQTLQNPVEFCEPVVGVVDLEHSRLRTDGSWEEWESAVGLQNFSSRNEHIMSLNMNNLTDAKFRIMIQDRMIKEVQAQVLRPPAYELINSSWQPPKESRQRAVSSSAGGRGARGRGGRTQPQTTMQQPSGGVPAGNRAQQGLVGILPDEPQDWLTQDEIRIWAHDSLVKPNEHYRFRMRIGIFNPIAGKDWFTADQQHLKDEILVWSEWATPVKPGPSGADAEEEFIQVPQRVVFFPKRTGTNTDQENARVVVYRWQNGKWNQRTFTVGPGSAIGEETVEPAGPDEDPVTIDYRTGVTLIDIIPDQIHYTETGRTMTEVVTLDLVYREANGTIKWLGANPATWPKSLIEKRNEILQSLNNQVP